MSEFRVCHVDELDDPGSLEVELPCKEADSGMFIVKVQGRLYAYVNSCPHTGVPLNWLPDQFLDYSGELIQCALHGALFRPQDGFCLHGPCQGQFLGSLPVTVRDRQIYVSCE